MYAAWDITPAQVLLVWIVTTVLLAVGVAVYMLRLRGWGWVGLVLYALVAFQYLSFDPQAHAGAVLAHLLGYPLDADMLAADGLLVFIAEIIKIGPLFASVFLGVGVHVLLSREPRHSLA